MTGRLYANRCSTFVTSFVTSSPAKAVLRSDLIGIVGGIGGVHPSTRGEEYWDGETFTNGWSCHYSHLPPQRVWVRVAPPGRWKASLSSTCGRLSLWPCGGCGCPLFRCEGTLGPWGRGLWFGLNLSPPSLLEGGILRFLKDGVPVLLRDGAIGHLAGDEAIAAKPVLADMGRRRSMSPKGTVMGVRVAGIGIELSQEVAPFLDLGLVEAFPTCDAAPPSGWWLSASLPQSEGPP